MTAIVSHPGLISARSMLPFAKTVANLLLALERRGMRLHARIDHTANARAAGLQLRPTELFVFNYPEAEGPILARCPVMGLDLPRKIAVWEDERGEVWIGYTDPLWLCQRYGAGHDVRSLLQAMATSFTGIALEAGGRGAQLPRGLQVSRA
jgi:uncharacterized protein (DUF302 family)